MSPSPAISWRAETRRGNTRNASPTMNNSANAPASCCHDFDNGSYQPPQSCVAVSDPKRLGISRSCDIRPQSRFPDFGVTGSISAAMNVSEIFIRRPIATSLLMLGLAVMGVIAYRALPVSDLPNVDFPTLNVGASLPGGDPGTLASAVASPLERQFTTIAGINEMTSSSSTGSSNVTLQFDLSRNIDSAAVDVETAIAAAMPLLPAGMPAPPSFRKFNPSDQPIMFLGLTSKT